MKKVLLIVLTFATSIMYAQTNSGFKGRVLDETNQPLPGATIYIKSFIPSKLSKSFQHTNTFFKLTFYYSPFKFFNKFSFKIISYKLIF